MLLQRSGVMLVYASQYFYTSPKNLYYVTSMIIGLFRDLMMLCSQFILCFFKEKLSRYCYTSIRKHVFTRLITVLNIGKHKNMLCLVYDNHGAYHSSLEP